VLAEKLKRGEIDVAIVALPFDEQGIVTQPVYDEHFVVAVPREHPWATRKSIRADDLAKESLLLLGTGHCFRDQVLNACPSLNRSSATPGTIQKTVEGSSLETIRLMVASGLGLTVLPASRFPRRPAPAICSPTCHSRARPGSPRRAGVAEELPPRTGRRGAPAGHPRRRSAGRRAIDVPPSGA